MSDDHGTRFDRAELDGFTREVLIRAGLRADFAADVAEVLIEADMMGHDTHGLALMPVYLKALKDGAMAPDGEIEVLADLGACATWNCRRLPGAVVVKRAMDEAIERAGRFGCCTIAISDSYHMGALAVYLARATQKGMMAILASSTVSTVGVAPFGGLRSIITPNPIAAGIPTSGDPIILDISASITTKNKAMQYIAAGRRFPAPWAMDAEGNPTDDPNVLNEGGSLLPVGGLDHGHKGYALGLMVDLMTQGLSGVGRVDNPGGTFTAATLQVFDPRGFAGTGSFNRIADHLVDLCHTNPPRPGVERVRVPGDQAMVRRRAALERGVPLSGQIRAGLDAAAKAADVALLEARA